MRHFITLLLLVSTMTVFATPVVKKKAVVSGTVLNDNVSEIVFREYGLPFNLDADNKFKIDSEGKFKATLELKEPQYYYLIYRRSSHLVYLSPGDKLTINFNAQSLESSIEFEGKGAGINNYLKTRVINDRITQQMIHYEGKRFGIFSLEPQKYQQVVNDDRAKAKVFLDNFYEGQEKKNKKIKEFVAYEKAALDGLHASLYLMYPAYHGAKTKTAPIDYWSDIDMKVINDVIQTDNEDLLMSKLFRDALNQYALSMSEKQFIEAQKRLSDRTAFIEAAYFNVDQLFPYQWQKDYIKSRVLYEQIAGNGIDGMEKVYENYRSLEKIPSTYRAAVDKEWQKFASIAVGADAPDITGTDLEGKTIKLSDFKGKLVYIDVWATWCGPCRKEIPYLKETEERFHGKDVVFLSISTDNKVEKWKGFVKNNDMKGVQMHCPGGWGSEVCKKYNITGIPRFMLIGKDGKIITTRAHRPSQGIDHILEEHLK